MASYQVTHGFLAGFLAGFFTGFLSDFLAGLSFGIMHLRAALLLFLRMVGLITLRDSGVDARAADTAADTASSNMDCKT